MIIERSRIDQRDGALGRKRDERDGARAFGVPEISKSMLIIAHIAFTKLLSLQTVVEQCYRRATGANLTR